MWYVRIRVSRVPGRDALAGRSQTIYCQVRRAARVRCVVGIRPAVPNWEPHVFQNEIEDRYVYYLTNVLARLD